MQPKSCLAQVFNFKLSCFCYERKCMARTSTPTSRVENLAQAWTNFSLQDEPWAEFSTLEVAACVILCTYGPVLQNNLT